MTRRNRVFLQRRRLPPRAAPAAVALLLAGCAAAAARRPAPVAAADAPGEYEVRNASACVARVASVGRAGSDRRVLTEVPARATARVTLDGPGRRLHWLLYRDFNATGGSPDYDCRTTGDVSVRRVGAGD